jgi:hypothetical protein
MNRTVKTPWHLWVVGMLSLVWNGFGVTDYMMTNLKNMWWLRDFAQLTAEQIAYFDTMPSWATAAWAFGVWGAFLGSLLLVLRSRHAVTAFAVSLAGLALVTFYQFVLSPVDLTELFGPGPMLTTLVIWLIEIALLYYARRQTGKGVLR